MFIHTSQALLSRYNRLDPAFAAIVNQHQARADELAAQLTPDEAQSKVQAFPVELVKHACAPMAADYRKPLTASSLYPFLALALIEQALPAYQQNLQATRDALETTQAQLEQLAQSTFSSDSPRKSPRPR